jgi:hypothetical protein
MPSIEDADREQVSRDMLTDLQDEMRRISVADYLTYTMQSIFAIGWRRLGLTPDTAAERDLDQSRLAIDAFKVLLQVLEEMRPAQEVSALRALLSQMQLEYVASLDPSSEPETD